MYEKHFEHFERAIQMHNNDGDNKYCDWNLNKSEETMWTRNSVQ